MVQTSVFDTGESISDRQIACLRATCVALREHSRWEYAALERGVEVAFLGLQRENAELELIASQWRRCCAEQEWACIKAREEVQQSQERVQELEEKMELMDMLYAEEQRRWQQVVASLEAEVERLRKSASVGPLDGLVSPTEPLVAPEPSLLPGEAETVRRLTEASAQAPAADDENPRLLRGSLTKPSEKVERRPERRQRPTKQSRSRTKRPLLTTVEEASKPARTTAETRVQASVDPPQQAPAVRNTAAKRRRRVSFSSPGAQTSIPERSEKGTSVTQNQNGLYEADRAEQIGPEKRQKAPDLHFQKAQLGRRKLFSFITQHRLVAAKPRTMPTLTQF
ncbi:hypothetical protein F1559_002026 [Cyanidiococcus yangmingshanensis]|uniref:Uncharacterized protein n=1 Tax=Cyanidiococcus yangmingshanensis TaxID=2690220 RepID=A0A7J7IIS3_9RHOD|nr:hypothetical protein F1559_002026 [Cyanidiococcus yangmingshanensis]